MSKQNKKTKKNISRNTKKDKKRDKSNKNNNTYSGKGEYNPQSFKDMPLGTRIIAIICILILAVFPFIFIVVCISVVIFTAISDSAAKEVNKRNSPIPKTEPNSSYREYIYLDETEEGWYTTVSSDADYDKKLEWDNITNSYYDSDSKCYIWYNNDTNEWQYWFKNVSSDYGDYGWMKCGHNSWEIEKSSGNWVPLPEKYARGKLWYIQ